MAVLLVGALLLCHGVFGFAHEICCHECASTGLLASMEPAGHEDGPDRQAGHASSHSAEEDAAGGQAFAGYFGIALALFGMAVLGLLRGMQRRYADVFAPLYRTRSSPASARLPRGPTLPSFRCSGCRPLLIARFGAGYGERRPRPAPVWCVLGSPRRLKGQARCGLAPQDEMGETS